MQYSAPEIWLRDWFKDKAPDRELQADENYFDAGAIDSFQVIELIEAIEDAFSCRFTETDFQDRRFVTLSGLAAIISEKARRADG
jgi:acyl carrier protein